MSDKRVEGSTEFGQCMKHYPVVEDFVLSCQFIAYDVLFLHRRCMLGYDEWIVIGVNYIIL